MILGVVNAKSGAIYLAISVLPLHVTWRESLSCALVQGACLQAGQLDMAAPSLAAAVSNGTISPSLVVPVPRPAAVAAVPTGEPVAVEVGPWTK